jgi:hypothetical protein
VATSFLDNSYPLLVRVFRHILIIFLGFVVLFNLTIINLMVSLPTFFRLMAVQLTDPPLVQG